MGDDKLEICQRTDLPSGGWLGFDESRRLTEIRVPLVPEADAYGRRRAALREAEEYLGHPLRLTFWRIDAGETYVMADLHLGEPRMSLAFLWAANENGALAPVS